MAVSHVRNPLSVIAIFAGLAELGGTAVMPLLEETVQSTYVWFLMLFPSLIVVLFFLTLWFAHTNLYAPSDFTDEQNFVSAAGSAIKRKYREEATEAAEQAKDAPGAPIEATSPVAPSELAPDGNSNLPNNDDAKRLGGDDSSRAKDWTAADYRRKLLPNTFLVAEELAFIQVAEEFGAFRRHVSPVGNQNLIFDGVQTKDGKIKVLEVKFTKWMPQPVGYYAKAIEQIASYIYSLSPQEQRKVSIVLAIVSENRVPPGHVEGIEKSLHEMFPFDITLRVYEMIDLQQNVLKLT